MEISIKHILGQRQTFNVQLHVSKGADPFLEIRGCRLVEGKNGAFISYPARQSDDGKYWHHVRGGDGFNAAVIAKVIETKPAPSVPKGPESSALEAGDND